MALTELDDELYDLNDVDEEDGFMMITWLTNRDGTWCIMRVFL